MNQHSVIAKYRTKMKIAMSIPSLIPEENNFREKLKAKDQILLKHNEKYEDTKSRDKN